LPHLARCSSNPVGLSPPRREAALPYAKVVAAVATIKISANATAVDLSPNDTSFQVQTRTKQRRLVPRAIREISVFRASVLAIAIASMSIEIEIRNICRAALTCGIIGILPCCRGRSLPIADWPIIPTRGGLRQDLCRRIMPTVLVFGGAGFIGSHTCKAIAFCIFVGVD
jgi:hypothetical protein